MTLPEMKDKSTKSVLMAMVAEMNKAIDTDTVKARLDGRYVTRLLDYME